MWRSAVLLGAMLGGDASDMFTVPAAYAPLIKEIATAQAKVRSGRRAGFEVTVDDQLGRDRADYLASHPAARDDLDGPVLSDPRAALAALPLGQLQWIGPAATLAGNPLGIPTGGPQRRDAVAFIAGRVWTGGAVFRHGRIVLLRLRRRIPPPF